MKTTIKILLILLTTISIASCKSNGYHYSSKDKAYISKTDTIRDYYLPNRVY